MFDTYQERTYSLRPSTAHCTESWCLASVETLAQSPDCRIVTRETPAAKAAEGTTPQKEPNDICALATQRIFLTQEEMVLAQTGRCCLLLPKNREVT